MPREKVSPMDAITELWPQRHDNRYLRILLWNCIGYERKHRARQATRYPLASRFLP